MARKLIDISVPLQNDVPADPPGNHPAIHYTDHQQSLARMLPFFPGLKAEDLPDGQGWAVEQVNLSTHNGTHLDAPWHFHPTMNRGERSWTMNTILGALSGWSLAKSTRVLTSTRPTAATPLATRTTASCEPFAGSHVTWNPLLAK